MQSNNFVTHGSKILAEFLADILYFPLWWYSKGLLQFLTFLNNFLANRQKGLALFVWVKNIGRPMYGQTDIPGKIISFFIRLVQIIARGAVMLFWLVVAVVIFILWLAIPIAVVFQLIYQLAPI